MTAPPMIRITLAYSPAPRELHQLQLSLPEGSTLQQALAASGWLQQFPGIETLPVGVWGRKEPLTHVLRERDRVEIYRALRCDPKEARRLRYRQKAQRDAERAAARAARGAPAQP
ncbi:MAG: RnfH family protein [Rubrivivax sp.]|nr:RnfH family protein [Rubrivivax sp.]